MRRHESIAELLQETRGYAGLHKNLTSGLGQDQGALAGALSRSEV